MKNQLNTVSLIFLMIVTFLTYLWWAEDTVGQYWESSTGLIASFSLTITIFLFIFGFVLPFSRQKERLSTGLIVGLMLIGLVLMVFSLGESKVSIYILMPLSRLLFFAGGFLLVDKYVLFPMMKSKQSKA